MTVDTTTEAVARMCRCAPFANNEQGIPQMVATLRTLAAERDAAVARAEAAEAIVERLPMTADGVRVVPGMEIWRPHTEGHAHAELRAHYRDGFSIHAVGWGMNVRGDEIYSTEQAALAAREAKEPK